MVGVLRHTCSAGRIFPTAALLFVPPQSFATDPVHARLGPATGSWTRAENVCRSERPTGDALPFTVVTTMNASLWPTLRPLLLAGAAVGLLGCNSDPTGPGWEDADLKVLFVGNSLTYVNDLPGLVETVAEAAGHSVETEVMASPNFGLGDHWLSGTPRLIRELRPDIVILQQGPSTLASSQAYLREWTDSLSRVIREVGAQPALLMVWPPDDPQYSFGAVLASYRAAAEDVGGIFIPAGVSWLEVWKQDSTARLWGPDGFHPAPLGSIVAALTVVRTLFDESLVGLPARMVPQGSGRPVIDLSPAEAAIVLTAVDRAVEAHAFR